MKKFYFSERFKKPPRSLTIEPYLRDVDDLILSDETARDARIVPLVILDFGSVLARFKQVRFIGRMLVGAISEMRKSASSIKENPYGGKKSMDEEALVDLESFAKGLGVADIGYTEVNPKYIFRNYGILYKNAIVFTIEMKKDKIKLAPEIASFIEIFRTYYRLGVIVNEVAEYLRERGYNAQAGPAIGGDVNYIPLAIDAGLGFSGKSGLLITKQNGSRVRLAAVYTDIENLPFSEENPHEWIREYCEGCNICVKKCPAGAIFSETKMLADGGPEFIDFTKCAVPFSNDNGCTLCVKHCPFSYGDYDKIKAKFEKSKVMI